MLINVAEVFKVKKQLTDTYSSLKKSFQGITNEITEINNNLQSPSLTSRNNMVLEKISALSTSMESNLSGLVMFMEGQLNNYEISTNEAKTQLLELIRLIESTFGSKGELLNPYSTVTPLVSAQATSSATFQAGAVGVATLGAAAPWANTQYTPSEDYSYVPPEVSPSTTKATIYSGTAAKAETPTSSQSSVTAKNTATSSSQPNSAVTTTTTKPKSSSETKTPVAQPLTKNTPSNSNNGNIPSDLYSKDRVSQNYGGSNNHLGVDIGWNEQSDDNIYAYGDGVVVAAVNNQVHNPGSGGMASYGNYVDIQHPDGTVTRYAHMNSINVKVGDIVSTGENIGFMGDTGNANGKHLHFEYYDNTGKRANPEQLLSGGTTKI